MTLPSRLNRRISLAVCLAGGMALGAGTAFAQGGPEQTQVTIGLPVTTSTFLPIYLAQEEGFFEEEGLEVELTTFRGGSDLVRGMIAGAVDIGVTSLAGVTVGIKAGQDLKVFYGGFNMAIFDWYAVPSITSMEETKGARFGVTRYGSSTDFLTRYALVERGLDPEADVKIIQGGGSAERMAAMESGQLDVNIFAPPEKFMAADEGYNLILRQTELAPDYPFHVWFAREQFIEENPETIKAVLRAFIKGVRLAKDDKERSIQILMDRIGMEEQYAGRTYDDFIDLVYEDGRLPTEEGLKAFFQQGIMAGEYEDVWPKEKYWVSTFHDTYEQWKP